MPGPSRTQRAEAKYNVTTDFPHLGLHSAAATGNIGLVKYALSHGQPVNSVLDGVLPLHAACSGGDEIVVRFLIENGADVNAPRLPRRYSNEKSRANSALIIGTSGSTPLHFASANGHSAIVITLLQHGAHPDRADKHGITPEMLARDNGFANTADLLRNWKRNKDRDLWERQGSDPAYYEEEMSRERQASMDGDCNVRRRLKMKRSVDFALSTLKGASPSHAHTLSGSSTATVTSRERSPSASRPLGEYTFYPPPLPSDAPPSERRPSLPHIYDTVPAPRKSFTAPGTSSRRPQSAGNGAAEPGPRRRLGSKYSLLNLFKKANPDGAGSESSSESSSPGQLAPLNTASSSPLPTSRSFSDKSTSPIEGAGRFCPRYGSESTGSGSGAGVGARIPVHVASAFDLDSAYVSASEHARTRSGSGSRARNEREGGTPPSRPGPSILKGHLRNPSSQSQQESGSLGSRSLRFDSNASVSRTASPRPVGVRGASGVSPGREADLDLRGHGSVGSLKSGGWRLTGERESPPVVESPQVAHTQLESEAERGARAVDDDEEEEYGEVIRSGLGFEGSPQMETRARLPEISTQTRGAPSLSPILSPEEMNTSPTVANFPFSLDRPPPIDVDAAQPQRPGGLRVSASPGSGDNRLRGDSISSTATDVSVNPPSSSSTTGINTPATGCYALPVPGEYDSAQYDDGLQLEEDGEFGVRVGTRRADVPVQIDIRSISSHAQAEALVRQTQKEILEMDWDRLAEEEGAFGSVPLSARLAAYGQSLAIERKLREERERAERRAREVEDFGRKGGFNHERSALGHGPAPPRVKKMRRPHTAGGTESSVDHPHGQPVHMHARHAQGLLRSTSVHIPAHSPLAQEDPVLANSADIEIVETAATPVEDTMLMQKTPSSKTAPPTYEHARSRTPDPEPERYNLDDDSAVCPVLGGVGVPLSRVSTAPCEETLQSRSVRSRRDQRIASANKLTRMGFVAEGYQAASGYASPGVGAGNKQRFGGLKSLVQSLKGRS